MPYRRTDLEGLADLKANLQMLGTDVSTKTGVTANRKAAQLFAGELKQSAPYDPKGDSPNGHLRDNIRVRKVRANRVTVVRHAVDTGKAFWGWFLEFGTAKMGARPWWRPAFDAFGDLMVKAQVDELRNGIERACRRMKIKPTKGP